MAGDVAAAGLALVVTTALWRMVWLWRRGVQAMKFGSLDRSDFLITPLAVVFAYEVAASVFGWPRAGATLFWHSWANWLGAILTFLGWILFAYSVVTLGSSFRVGIDTDQPGKLVTSGPFRISRNPLYTGMAMVLIGIFLALGDWVFMLFALAGLWVMNRQVLREEAAMEAIYGDAKAMPSSRDLVEFLQWCMEIR